MGGTPTEGCDTCPRLPQRPMAKKHTFRLYSCETISPCPTDDGTALRMSSSPKGFSDNFLETWEQLGAALPDGTGANGVGTPKEVPSISKSDEEIAKFTVGGERSNRDRAARAHGVGGVRSPHAHGHPQTTPPPQVDERLSEVERTVLYLNGGISLQQRHAVAK